MMSYYHEQEAKRRRNNILFIASLIGEKIMALKISADRQIKQRERIDMVNKKSRTSVYLNTNLKEQAKEIYKLYGLSLSETVNMFLAQSVLNRGLPFEVKMPNDITLQTMNDIETGENYEDVNLN